MDQYYNSISSGYENLYGEEQRDKVLFLFENQILDENGISELAVLDVGCGSSVYHDLIKPKLFVGIDPSIGLLRKGHVLSFLGFSESLPFLDNSFDVIISMSAVQNFFNIDKSLHEFVRVCRTGGKIVVSVSKKFDRVIPKLNTFLKIMEEFLYVSDLEVFEQEKDFIFVMRKI